MAVSRKKSSARTRRPHLTRAQLLPMPAAELRATSLRNHLALVALRRGEGNGDLLAGLLRTVYVTYFVLDGDQDAAALQAIACAGRALHVCVADYAARNRWEVPEAACRAIETVLRLHDEQLAAVPVHRLDAAGVRLGRILATGEFPEIRGSGPSSGGLAVASGFDNAAFRASQTDGAPAAQCRPSPAHTSADRDAPRPAR